MSELFLTVAITYIVGWMAGYWTCHFLLSQKQKESKVRVEDLRPRD